MKIKFSEVLKHCAKIKKKNPVTKDHTSYDSIHNKCRLGKSIKLESILVIAKAWVKTENWWAAEGIE